MSVSKAKIQNLLKSHKAERLEDIDGREVWILSDNTTIIQFPTGHARIDIDRVSDIAYLLEIGAWELDYFID